MKVQSSTSGRSVTVHATPRRNYIALLRLQVRIRIQSKKKGKNSSIDNDDNGTAAAAKNNSFRNNNNDTLHHHQIQTTVTRRRHCLLVSSNQRLRSLVLRFRDVSSCIAFTDQLVALNPPPQEPRFHDWSDHPVAAAAEDDHHEYHAAAAAATSGRQHGTAQENDEALSYVGRLLHSEDFAALVDNLEACIASSEDGASLLEALVVSSSRSGNDNDANNNAAIADDEESNN